MTARRRWLPYFLIGTLAIGGQYIAGVAHLHPEGFFEYAAIVAVAVGIEAMAVWLSVLARERARVGEDARLHWAIACLFATIAVAINIVGHGGDLYMSIVFGGFSLAGFVIFISEQISQVRSAWDPDGKIRSKVPAYAHLKQFEASDAVIRRARLIAQTWAEQNRNAPDGLGPVTVLELARQQLAEEARRTRIQRVMRSMYGETGLTADQIELALLAYDTEAVAAGLIAGADNAGLAAGLSIAIQPDRLANVSQSAINRLTGGEPRREPPRPAPRRELSLGGGSPARDASSGGSPSGEPPLEGSPDPAHAEPVSPFGGEPGKDHPEWFIAAAQAWVEAQRAGRTPRNSELAQAGGVSLATLKRHKNVIWTLTITIIGDHPTGP